jgi:hypothetical protein
MSPCPEVREVSRRCLIGMMSCLGLAELTGCSPRTYCMRYRLTLTVADHGVLRTGSGVAEYRIRDRSRMLLSGGILVARSIGVAAIVPLSDGRVIAASLDRLSRTMPGDPPQVDGASYMPWRAYGGAYNPADDTWRNGHNAAYNRMQAVVDGPAVQLALRDAPPILMFADHANPVAVALVDPADPAKALGPNLSIRTITIQPTRDSPSFAHAYAVFPWLRDLVDKGTYLDGKHINNTNVLSNQIGASALIREQEL